MSFDQDTEWLMTTVEIDDDSLAEKWFQAICDAYEANPDDWTSFRQAFVTNAAEADSSFDSNFAEEFLRAAENDLSSPLDALRQMHENGVDELVRTYPILLAQKRAATAGDSIEVYDGANGEAYEGGYDGTEAYDEQNPDAAQPADVTTLGWVTDDQLARLEGALGAGWQAAVVETLDAQWPPWRAATEDSLAGFLNDWMETIIAQTAEPSEQSEASEPADADASERLETFQEVANDPALERIDHETLDRLMSEPDFDQRMAEAEAAVEAALA